LGELQAASRVSRLKPVLELVSSALNGLSVTSSTNRLRQQPIDDKRSEFSRRTRARHRGHAPGRGPRRAWSSSCLETPSILLGAASFAQSVAAEMLERKLSRCIIFQWWSGLARDEQPGFQAQHCDRWLSFAKRTFADVRHEMLMAHPPRDRGIALGVGPGSRSLTTLYARRRLHQRAGRAILDTPSVRSLWTPTTDMRARSARLAIAPTLARSRAQTVSARFVSRRSGMSASEGRLWDSSMSACRQHRARCNPLLP